LIEAYSIFLTKLRYALSIRKQTNIEQNPKYQILYYHNLYHTKHPFINKDTIHHEQTSIRRKIDSETNSP